MPKIKIVGYVPTAEGYREISHLPEAEYQAFRKRLINRLGMSLAPHVDFTEGEESTDWSPETKNHNANYLEV